MFFISNTSGDVALCGEEPLAAPLFSHVHAPPWKSAQETTPPPPPYSSSSCLTWDVNLFRSLSVSYFLSVYVTLPLYLFVSCCVWVCLSLSVSLSFCMPVLLSVCISKATDVVNQRIKSQCEFLLIIFKNQHVLDSEWQPLKGTLL